LQQLRIVSHEKEQGDSSVNNLIYKTVVGFIQLSAVIAVSLFLSAGSLDFWQAWIYLGVFTGCNLLLTVYMAVYDQKLLESRLSSGPDAEKQESQKTITGLINLCLYTLFILPGLDFRFQWSHVPTELVIFANVLVSIAFLIIFSVFKESSYTSAIVEVSAEQQVISTGPYSIVRHPMYLGVLLLFLVTPIALGSFWTLLVFIPFTILFGLRLLDEEKFLADNLLGYREYCQKTQYHLLPLIW
jgi:protein-S-isoprenylcysteine O-methyltransferase Ste14